MNQFVKSIVKKSFHSVGLEVRRRRPQEVEEPDFGDNQVVPNVWKRPIYRDLIPFRLCVGSQPIVLLGSLEEIAFYSDPLIRQCIEVIGVEWDWETETLPTERVSEGQIALCKLPMNERQWRAVKRLKERYGSRVIGLQELVLPFTAIRQAQASFTYNLTTLEKIAPYYAGEKFFGPLEDLHAVFPLSGKSVIEFGPMDGAQTAGLIHLGVKSVTCIEARGENFIKTLVAKYAFGWDNVRLVMDDFHNADDLKYGSFDLVFAHGVYYHSVAPFFFFENLISLSDNIFIGGYIYADPSASSADLETLEYDGKTYQVKRIPMGRSYNTGVNQYGYHFNREDMLSFFGERNYQVVVISDEESDDTYGDRYLRFLATKK